ncbi:hypothetical protein LWI28_016049 [Acer negundo]|uniref:Uncharacterized protein n=1 Tax=Acer negundo TaxID=4023 RepID=A0AAD5NNH8_ACENE|nr:hypothetical protein LWI28_016049 [Acer negundo]
MVFSCVRREEAESMAMAPERSSKPLHNFTLPRTLMWGNQRYLRCMKVQDSSTMAAAAAIVDHRLVRRRSSPNSLSGFSDAGRRRERVLLFKKPGTDGGGGGGGGARRRRRKGSRRRGCRITRGRRRRRGLVSAATAAAQDSARPWNLRTRRAACKDPNGGPARRRRPRRARYSENEERKPSSSSSPMRSGLVLAPSREGVKRRRRTSREGGQEGEMKFSMALSKKEIEEDFMELTLFPGLWLTEVTADSYKVPELAEIARREEAESMAMAPERSSKPLHNFTLPRTLMWGNQRYLRCMKVQDSSTMAAAAAIVDHRLVRRRSSPNSLSGFSDAGRRRERVLLFKKPGTDGGGGGGGGDEEEEEEEEGIEAVREKIMNDLKTAADKMKDAILRKERVSDYEREEEEGGLQCRRLLPPRRTLPGRGISGLGEPRARIPMVDRHRRRRPRRARYS